ncbi:NHL repeat-containing protein [Nocardioides ultimimeridianus]
MDRSSSAASSRPRARRLLLAVTTLVAGSGAVVLQAAAPASAAVSVSQVGGFVADDVVSRVFVGDRTNGLVKAADYAGAAVGSVTVPGVTDLAVSPDGAVLYAASPVLNEVDAIDTTTLAVLHRYTAATTDGPTHVAFAGGKVWFTYGDQWEGDLGSIDPSTGTVTMGRLGTNQIWGPGLLDADTSQPGMLAIGETGLSTDSMAVLDVSSGSVTKVAFHQGNYTLNNGISDIDLTPGGTQVLVNGSHRQAYADGAFTAAGSYPTGVLADVSATGYVASAAGSSVTVYPAGSPTAVSTFPAAGGATAITWGEDESHLFVMRSSGASQVLDMIDLPTQPHTSPALTLTASRTVFSYGSSGTFTAHLGASTNRTVSIWADPAGTAPNHLLASGTVDSSGNLSASMTMTRNTKVTAVFAGGGLENPRTVALTVGTRVKIATRTTGYFRTTSIGGHRYLVFHHTVSPKTVTTMTAYPGRKMQAHFDYSTGSWRTGPTSYWRLSSTGKVTLYLNRVPTGVRIRLRSSYISGTSGDAVNTTTYGAWTYLVIVK